MTITRSPSHASGAVFSDCERYRYLLWRQWDDLTAKPGTVLGALLNPSTADELRLDPTLTRFRALTVRLGFSRFEIVNAYALRSTDPRGLLKASDPVGPDNDRIIAERIAAASIVVVGWGAFALAQQRAARIVELAAGKPLFCLGANSNGSPKHPLYLRADAALIPWPVRP